MKKAILTGATGFIGSHFAEYLTAQGVDVLALGRRDLTCFNELRNNRLARTSFLNIDMDCISTLPVKVKNMNWDPGDDCVFINLAWGGKDRLSDLDVEAQMLNVNRSYRAIESAHQLQCTRFIHIGTMEEAFTYKYLDLDYTKDKEYNRHVVYSVAKIAAKRALKLKSAQLGLDFIHVLHSHVMGPDDDKDSFLQVTLQKLVNGDKLSFSSGEQLFDVISLDDCSSGYFHVCQSGRPGFEYWVGSGDPRPLKEYVERMYKMFPSDQPLNFGSMPFNDVKLSVEDFSIDLLTKHTNYRPTKTYEDTVLGLHSFLFNS